MGALLIKADCTGCFNGGKQCRVSPLVVIDKTSPPERRLSEEIIKELKTCGILTSNTATARGGLAFDIMPDGIVQTRKPKRLQLYNQIVTKSTPEEHKVCFNIVYHCNNCFRCVLILCLLIITLKNKKSEDRDGGSLNF